MVGDVQSRPLLAKRLMALSARQRVTATRLYPSYHRILSIFILMEQYYRQIIADQT